MSNFYYFINKLLFLKLIMFSIVMLHVFTVNGQVGCSAPVSFITNVTLGDCISDNSITITNVGNVPQDATIEYGKGNPLQWQTSNVLTDLNSGSQRVGVRFVCNGAIVSDSLVRLVSVASNSYSSPVISVRQSRISTCNNGRITITPPSGSAYRAPFSYALVASQNAAEPILPNDYVRPKRSVTYFDSLPAGQYYVRVYDVCNNSNTYPITVTSSDSVRPYSKSLQLIQQRCDQLSLNFPRFGNSDTYPYNSGDYFRLWVQYPNGNIDTLLRAFTPGIGLQGANINMDRIGSITNPNLNFPDNLDPSIWPLRLIVTAKNMCGIVYVDTFNIAKPVFSHELTNVSFECDSSSYRFESKVNNLGDWRAPSYANNSSLISLDTGRTWFNAYSGTNYSSTTISFKLPNNKSNKVMLISCKDTFEFIAGIPVRSPITAEVMESTRDACPGYTNLGFRVFTGSLPITVTMVSGPAGQTMAPFVITNLNGGAWGPSFLPGTYIFRFSDLCGIEYLDTVTTQRVATKLTGVNYELNTCQDVVTVTFPSSRTYWEGKPDSLNTYGELNKPIYYRARILPGSNYVDAVNNVVTINVNGGEGSYRVIAYDLRDCDADTFVFAKTNVPLTLTTMSQINSCPGLNNAGTYLAFPNGGRGAYTYSLYRNTVHIDSLVEGPTSNHIFNNLDTAKVYRLVVSDNCGSTLNSTVQFSSIPTRVASITHSSMPCDGEDFSLAVPNGQGISYQWYKNDAMINGATTSILTLNNLSQADSGSYSVSMSAGTCNALLASLLINPDSCGSALPIEWLYFNALPEKMATKLTWATAKEVDVKGFYLERSLNARIWETVGFVPTKSVDGRSTEMISYDFIDNHNLSGKIYYRIRQVDMGATYSYSQVQSVYFDTNNEVYLYPNPAKSTVLISKLQDVTSIQLFDALGKMVKPVIYDESSEVLLDLEGLASGLYFVTIKQENGTVATYKLIKE